MDRLAKKCLIASAGTHLLLFVVLIFGSAFFISRERIISPPTLKAVPTRVVDDALTGGGGSPKVAPSDAQQRGQTLVPQPAEPPAVKPQHIEKPPPKPVEPTPRVEVKPKPERHVEVPKPIKPPKDKPQKEPVKEAVKPHIDPHATKVATTTPLELTPVVRPSKDKAKEQAEAQARAEAAAAAAAKTRIARAMANTTARLKEGFSQGTVVEIHGDGSEASADYAQFVKSVYEDAWTVTDDLTDESATAKVSVTIARSGRVISARVERHSGDSDLDKSVQRALDKVSFVRPFPAGATDEQRTFLINFNLKAKRSLG